MKLAYTTHDPHLDRRLTVLVELLELIFPARVRAYYVSGSVVNGGLTKRSDLDLIVVFKGAFAAGEAECLRSVGRQLTVLGDMRYDLAPRSEMRLKKNGATGIKLATALLYGEDIRDEVPFEPLEIFLHDALAGFVYYARELRGETSQLSYPVTLPDSADRFGGYTDFGYWDGQQYHAGTRIIINCITLGATVFVLLESGERCSSKLEVVQRYQTLVNGRWGEWLYEMFSLCKLEWHYELPATAAEQQQLTDLLGHMAAYENMILERSRDTLASMADIPVVWRK